MPRKTSIQGAKKTMGNPAFIVGVIVIGFITIVGAVYIGKSDSGEINVSAAIESSNQANNAAGGDASRNVETVPEAFKNMTNGGLVAQENQPETPVVEQAPSEEVATSSATSTSPEEGTEPVAAEGDTEVQTETIETTENGAQ